MLLHRSGLCQQVRLFSGQSAQHQASQQQTVAADTGDVAASQLTAQQRHELTAAVLSSFKANSKGSCELLLKHLDEDSKKELLAALEHAHEQQQQHLSR